ncbi:S8 family serine peptidase [Paenibacillus tarimensis]
MIIKGFRKIASVILAFTLIFSFFTGLGKPVAAESSVQERLPFVPGELIVKYKSDRQQDLHISSKGKKIALEKVKTIPSAKAQLMKIPKSAFTAKALQSAKEQLEETKSIISQLRGDPDVEYAQPNFLYYSLATFETPNDPGFTDLWGLDAVNAPDVWSVTEGNGVTVAVIDTGTDPFHEDLQGNLLEGYHADMRQWGNEQYISAADDYHGTHVSGTITAIKDNETGVVGVAPHSKVIPVNILTGGDVTSEELADAISVLKSKGVKVANNSYGANYVSEDPAGDDKVFKNAIAESGMLFVVAAGNEGIDNDTNALQGSDAPYCTGGCGPAWPASFQLDNLITVAATDWNDSLPEFSNYGANRVHVGAPGMEIVSTMPDSSYASLDGTSMAAPHVTGVAALMFSLHPDLAPAQVKQILMDSGTPLDSLKGVTVSGNMVNAENAIRVVRGLLAPSLLSAETNEAGTEIWLTFDKTMADPAGKHGQFSFAADETAGTFSAAALDEAEPGKIRLVIEGGAMGYAETVTVSYTPGDIESADRGLLPAFEANVDFRAIGNSAAEAALANAGQLTAGSAFDILITEAKNFAGDNLNGSINVRAASNLDGEIYTAAADFEAGTASIAIETDKVTTAREHTLTVEIAGVAVKPQIAVAVTHAAAASMEITQNITPPVSNGAAFANQPIITLKDAYGNVAASDNSTQVTSAKKDEGDWTLTGTDTAFAVNGIVTFTDLAAANAREVLGARLSFNSEGMSEILSDAVTLPAAPDRSAARAALEQGGSLIAGSAVHIVITEAKDFADDELNGSIHVKATSNLNGEIYNSAADFVAGTASIAIETGKLTTAGQHTVTVEITGVAAKPEIAVTVAHAAAASMEITANITAPESNGASFAQQPVITLKDTYGNVAVSDSSTQVTAGKKDEGDWALTGTVVVTAVYGVATFTDLRASNSSQIADARLSFVAEGMEEVLSASVTLPAPAPAPAPGPPPFFPAPANPVTEETELTPNVKASVSDGTMVIGSDSMTIETETGSDGQPSQFVSFDEEELAELIRKQTNLKRIVFKVEKEELSELRLSAKFVEAMKAYHLHASVIVEFAAGAIQIPVTQMDMTKLAQSLNADSGQILIHIFVNGATDTDNVIEKNNLKATSPVIEYQLKASAGDKMTEIKRFNQYIERTIEGAANFEPDRSTAVRLNEDGTFTAVPTRFEGNKAIFNSFTNSKYVVIEHETVFPDIADNHWAKNEIHKLASKHVIKGVTGGGFAPGGKTTRAEFAALLARSLGLPTDVEYRGQFKDVEGNEWFVKELAAAVEMGLIQGNTDGSFSPNALVTREQAAVMIARALSYLTITDIDANKSLSAFTDQREIASWAREAVEKLVQAGIIDGFPDGSFTPAGFVKRDQVAKMLERFLTKANLIN